MLQGLWFSGVNLVTIDVKVEKEDGQSAVFIVILLHTKMF